MLPQLHNTVVVAAFEGWNDAGDAASDAVTHLAAIWDALPIVEIDDEAYYDYQVNRPVIRQVDGVTRELEWPAMRISHCRPPDSDRDVVLMHGVEPNMRWRTFCDELLAVIDKLNVDTVVILGALLADTPHTRPVPVSGAAYFSGLSVPASWTSAVGTATGQGATAISNATAIPAAAEGAVAGNTPVAPPFGQFFNAGNGRKTPAYGHRLTFMTRPPAAG